MNVEYTNGQIARYEAENEDALLKKLAVEMERNDFKSAQVFKSVELPKGVVNNRANRRKYLYTNNPKHTDEKREAARRGVIYMGEETREMTYGEIAVGLSFNPSGDERVNQVKERYAQIIDLCNDLRTEAGQGEKGRLLSVAITEAQTAQMWAVKGITANS